MRLSDGPRRAVPDAGHRARRRRGDCGTWGNDKPKKGKKHKKKKKGKDVDLPSGGQRPTT